MSTHNVQFCGETRKNINTFRLKKHLNKSNIARPDSSLLACPIQSFRCLGQACRSFESISVNGSPSKD